MKKFIALLLSGAFMAGCCNCKPALPEQPHQNKGVTYTYDWNGRLVGSEVLSGAASIDNPPTAQPATPANVK